MNHQTVHFNYRPEIDGLRALAVLSVLLYHGDFGWLPGGFLGVDIFFVISGYLITGILLKELQTQRFSILNFYERRARRILPALMLVLTVTTIVAWLILPPGAYKGYSQSLVSVSTFLSNLYFNLTGGYFWPISEEKPLLHTWSLAVEEQFYIFFPPALWLLWRLGAKVLLLSISVAVLASLQYSEYLLSRFETDSAFYLISARAWELMAGSLTALLAKRIPQDCNTSHQWFSAVGVGLVITAILRFDASWPHPGLLTTIPIAGTVLFIAFGRSGTLAADLFSNRWAVFIGLISYSLYLWHQPLLAFVRVKSMSEPNHWHMAMAVSLAFPLAYVSWRFVEKPFRDRQWLSRRQVLSISIVALMVASGIGLSGHLMAGFPNRFQLPTYAESIISSPYRDQCHTEGLDFKAYDDACHYGGDNIRWAVLGDSHGVELALAAGEFFEPKNIGVKHLTFSGCPPAVTLPVEVEGCQAWLNQSIDALAEDVSIKDVIVTFRHAGFLYGEMSVFYPKIPSLNPEKIFDPDRIEALSDSLEAGYWQDFAAIVERLRQSGKRLHILMPVPELSADIEKLVTPMTAFSKRYRRNFNADSTVRYYEQRNAAINARLRSLAELDSVSLIPTTPVFCENGSCGAVRNGQALYFDDDHMTVYAASLVIREYVKQMR